MRTLGSYALLTRLASGDLGDLFLARLESQTRESAGGPAPDTPLVLKLVRADLAADPTFSHSFLAEGASAAALDHPGLVPLFEAARTNSELFSVHEHVAGQPLSAYQSRRSAAGDGLRSALICWIGAQVARALHFAHDAEWARGEPGEMVHAGLVPRVIMLGYSGHVALAGLGAGRARLGRPPTIARLPFAAPEILVGEMPDRRADIFSLGVILFEALTGRRLFRRASAADTRAAILDEAYPAVRQQLDLAPSPAAQIISAMIARSPQERPSTASEVALALEQGLSHSAETLSQAMQDQLAVTFVDERAAADRVLAAALERAAQSAGRTSSSPPPAPELRAVPAGTGPPSALASTPQTRQEYLTPQVVVAAMPINVEFEGPGDITDPEGRAVVSPLIARPPEGLEDIEGETPTPDEGQMVPSVTIETALAAAIAEEAATPNAKVRVPSRQASELRAPNRGESAPNDVPNRIARYQVRAAMGRSGASALYRARDPNVGRRVLLEVVDASGRNGGVLDTDQRIALLQREARLVGKLAHAGLPVLLDAGRDGPLYFLVYELIEGLPLDEWLERSGGPLTTDLLAGVVGDICEALGYLHRRSLVHGSVCAGSVRVDTEGRARLADMSFVGADGDADHPLRLEHAAALSPEVLTSGRYVAASDQFALGVLLYTALSGTPPFVGSTEAELHDAIRTASPTPLSKLVRNVDPALAEIVGVLLSPLPGDRFADIGVLQSRLQKRSPNTARDRVVSPKRGVVPSLLLVDDALDPALADQALADSHPEAAVVGSMEEALALLDEAPITTMVVSASCAPKPRELQRDLRRRKAKVDVRFVPSLAERLLGSAVDERGLVDCLIALMERVDALKEDVPGRSPMSPLDAVEGVVERLGLGRRAALDAGLALAARRLAERLEIPASSERIAAALPLEVQSLFAAIERFWTMPRDAGSPPVAPLVQVVAMIERYEETTRLDADGKRVSPRKALLALRRDAVEGRIDVNLVEALVSHLRDSMSALDLPVLARPRKALVIAGAPSDPSVELKLERAGYAVSLVEGDEMAAWQRMASGDFDGLLIGPTFRVEQSTTVMRLLRSGPRTENMAVVIMSMDPNDTIDEEVSRLGPTEILTPDAAPQRVIEAMRRLLPPT